MVKITWMMLHCMIDMMVWFVWHKEKLSNASLEEFHFWTENVEEYLVGLNDANGVDLLDLRVWFEGLLVEKKLRVI